MPLVKVIQIISDTNIGGAGTYLLTFLDYYDKSLFDMEVFLPYNAMLIPELKKRGVKYREVHYMEDASFNRKAVPELYKIFREVKPDIVHTHASLSARVAARVAGGIRIIHTRHSVFDQPEKNKKFPRKQISGFINNFFSDTIIAVSPAAKDNLTDIGVNPKKIAVVYNGVAAVNMVSDSIKLDIRKKYGLNEADFIVAIMARLVDVKGHRYILDAAKRLREQAPDIKILVAGTGSLENELKDRIHSDNLTNVIMMGFIKEINEIENIMDLQINASYGTEATSFSLLEGMSLGKPAVVSDFGGNPYVIEDGVNGLIVPKKDPEALARAILKMKNEKQLYEKASRESVRIFGERFTVQRMSDCIRDIYLNIKKEG